MATPTEVESKDNDKFGASTMEAAPESLSSMEARSFNRRERKRAKKDAARKRREARIQKNGGPPETTFLGQHKWLGGEFLFNWVLVRSCL